ncbi:MAG: helix-turn-helix transcriptional regulator [Eggerthellaceae bacterium]
MQGTSGRAAVKRADTADAAGAVVLGIALACVLAYSRAFVSGFAGVAQTGQGDAFGTVSFACSLARFLTLAGVAALGALGHRFASAVSLKACGLLMMLSALAVSAGAAGDAAIVAASVAGVASGFAMLITLLYLAARPVRCVVRASLLGLVAGGAAIGLMGVLPELPALLVLLVSGVAWVPCLLAADASFAPCTPDGGMTRSQAHRFPWFAAIMFCVCGMLGSLLYGFSTQLAWAAGEPTNPVAFGVAVAAVLVLTTLLVMRGGSHMQLVWVPLFVLLLASALLSCFDVSFANALAVSMLLASVFCYHFLRWMVFPALVGQSDVPHVLTCGLLLVLTNSFLNVSTGQALAQTLPEAMRAQGGVVSLVLLFLVCCLAVSWVVGRMQAPHGEGAPSGEGAPLAQKDAAGDPRASQEVVAVQGGANEEPRVDAAPRAAAAPDRDAPTADAAPVEIAPAETEPASEREPDRPADAESATDALDARCARLADEADLTPREREIFALTARGYSSPFIAEQLVISDSTVRFHQRNIYAKLGVHSKQELIALANSGL